MRLIMKLADKANQYIDEKKPWQLTKIEGNEKEVHEITSLAINLFKVLMTYLKPVLPEMAKRSEEFLNVDSLNWSDIERPLTNHKINEFKALMTRIEDEQIDQMVESSKV
jgi:methionyl-tRNA synthetase